MKKPALIGGSNTGRAVAEPAPAKSAAPVTASHNSLPATLIANNTASIFKKHN